MRGDEKRREEMRRDEKRREFLVLEGLSSFILRGNSPAGFTVHDVLCMILACRTVRSGLAHINILFVRPMGMSFRLHLYAHSKVLRGTLILNLPS